MIPEAAVEAAFQSMWGPSPSNPSDSGDAHLLTQLRDALEAAAPHMLREAWFEGFSTGMEYGEWWAGSSCTAPEPDNSNSNPYGGRA